MSLRRFDGSNFNFWKEQMQDYLIVKGQIDPIENEVAPEIYKANEWQKLDRIVRATIRMHLSESVYFTVLRSHKRNPNRSCSEKVFHQRLGRRSLRSTRFDRPIEQSG